MKTIIGGQAMGKEMEQENYYIIELRIFEDEYPSYRDSYGYFCNCEHHAEQFPNKELAEKKIEAVNSKSEYYVGKLSVVSRVVTELE